MSITKKSSFTSILPAEENTDVVTWKIPEVTGKRVPLADKEEQKKKQQKKQQKLTKVISGKGMSPALKRRIKERQDARTQTKVEILNGDEEIEYRPWISSTLEGQSIIAESSDAPKKMLFSELENLDTKRRKEREKEQLVVDDLRQKAWNKAYAEGLSQARKDGYKEGHEKGHEQGFKKGHEQGHAEGYATGEAYVNDLTQRFTDIMLALSEPLQQLDEDIQNQLTEMIHVVAKKVILEELRLQPEHILQVVKEAIYLLPATDRQATIFLHPEDVDEVTKILPDNIQWKVEHDETLQKGGCRLTTKNSQLDATVEKRLDEIIARLDV